MEDDHFLAEKFAGAGHVTGVFCDIVEQMSGGRMKIRVYGANEW